MQIASRALGDEHLLKYCVPHQESRDLFPPHGKSLGMSFLFSSGSSSLVLLFVRWLVKAINMPRLHICLHIKGMHFS